MQTIAEIFRSYEVLDAEGRHVNGTDKNGPNHLYGNAYEKLFPDRTAIQLMMEVGVADGSCLRAWAKIFPNAKCVGLDIHPSDLAFGDRIEFNLGDQCSRQDCERAAAGRQFDLIVEDATHQLANTLLTLYWLWPFVKPGGLYVVEEWEGASGDRYRIPALWSNAEVVDTVGPSGNVEPLVVFRKVPI